MPARASIRIQRPPPNTHDMVGWDRRRDFCLDASVRIEGKDRPGPKRLLRTKVLALDGNEPAGAWPAESYA
jgi:hypothetical protein